MYDILKINVKKCPKKMPSFALDSINSIRIGANAHVLKKDSKVKCHCLFLIISVLGWMVRVSVYIEIKGYAIFF